VVLVVPDPTVSEEVLDVVLHALAHWPGDVRVLVTASAAARRDGLPGEDPVVVPDLSPLWCWRGRVRDRGRGADVGVIVGGSAVGLAGAFGDGCAVVPVLEERTARPVLGRDWRARLLRRRLRRVPRVLVSSAYLQSRLFLLGIHPSCLRVWAPAPLFPSTSAPAAPLVVHLADSGDPEPVRAELARELERRRSGTRVRVLDRGADEVSVPVLEPAPETVSLVGCTETDLERVLRWGVTAGVPMVVPEHELAHEIVGDGDAGLLYPAGAWDCAALGCAQILSEPALATGLAAVGRARGAVFGHDLCARLFTEALVEMTATAREDRHARLLERRFGRLNPRSLRRS
jgi:hypothetical protein